MFVTEMFVLTYGMLNSAEEVQKKKMRVKARFLCTLDIQETDQKTNFTESRVENIKSSVYSKPVVTIPEKPCYFTSD